MSNRKYLNKKLPSGEFHIKPNFFEKTAWKDELLACGIDEVGRGCLAGPLVVSAVILPINSRYHLLKDSKVLTENTRMKAFEWITKNCSYSTVIVSSRRINSLNIYQATLLAMSKAFMQIVIRDSINPKKIKYLLIDAMPVSITSDLLSPGFEIHSFTKGETLSKSIAAASIVAKVTRDNMMKKIETTFPLFKFSEHKGYGTAAHQKEIVIHGPSIIHRKQFVESFKANKAAKTLQTNIFHPQPL